jgi:hypothetical protein
MVKNLLETIKAPASFLLDMKDVSEEGKKALAELMQMVECPDKGVKRVEVRSLLPEKLLAECKAYGADFPTDIIELNMRLGDFFFNLYGFNVKPANAPLAIKRHEKRLLELSEIFAAEEFDIPAYVKEAIVPVLEDEKRWNESQFSTFVNVKNDKGEIQPNYIGLTALGASFFRQVCAAATEALDT